MVQFEKFSSFCNKLEERPRVYTLYQFNVCRPSSHYYDGFGFINKTATGVLSNVPILTLLGILFQ